MLMTNLQIRWLASSIVAAVIIMACNAWYVAIFLPPTGSRLAKFFENKAHAYTFTMFTAFAALVLLLPLAFTADTYSVTRAIFLPFQQIALVIGIYTYRLSIQTRSLFIMEQSRLNVYPPYAVAVTYVCSTITSILYLLPADVQLRPEWRIALYCSDLTFGAVYTSLIGVFSYMFYSYIVSTEITKHQTAQQVYYVKIAKNGIVISFFVSLAALGLLIVLLSDQLWLQEIGGHSFNVFITACVALYRSEKVQLAAMKVGETTASTRQRAVTATMTQPFSTIQNTLNDIETRVVALPGYMSLNMNMFELQLEQKLGSGAEGQVCRATVIDPLLAQKFRDILQTQDEQVAVAVKIFDHGLKVLTENEATEVDPLADPDASFLQEVSIMSSLLGCPNIVQLLGFIEGDVNAIVMRVYQGSLSGLVTDQSRTLDFADISLQIVSGLCDMHKHGITHCDIKKQNVLINIASDGRILAYITDFGVSQVSLTKEKVGKRLNVRKLALTLPYAAPEILDAMFGHDKTAQQQDAKIEVVIDLNRSQSSEQQESPTQDYVHSRDIYAFGVLMWELLFRQAAWQNNNANQIVQAVVVDHQRPSVDGDTAAIQKARALYGKSAVEAFISLLQQCWLDEPAKRLTSQQVQVELKQLTSAN